MKRHVLTLIGSDRPGVIKRLAAGVSECGGNWLASRLSRLAGQFAGIVEYDLPESAGGRFEEILEGLRRDGFAINVQNAAEGQARAGGRVWHIELLGNDRPGIVQEVSRAVASADGNIEEWESGVSSSPMCGTPLFSLTGEVRLPEGSSSEQLQAALEAIGADLQVELRLTEKIQENKIV